MKHSKARRKAAGRRLTPESYDVIRQLYTEGRPLREIAAAAGCSIANVSARAHRMGLPSRQVSSGALPQQAIVNAYREGMSSDAIARQLGISSTTVIDIVRFRGVPVRPRGRTIVKDNRAECVRMYRQGMFQREIAAVLEMTLPQVAHRIRSVLGSGSHADGGRRRGARDKARRATA